MKFYLIVLASILAHYSVAQELSFDIHHTYARSVHKETLMEAKSLTDINPGYPASWISDYVSSEIKVTHHGAQMVAVGTYDVLNAEQQDLLKMADPGTDVIAEVTYHKQNIITKAKELNSLRFVVSFIPDQQAEYPGGSLALKQYIKEKAIFPLGSADVNKFQQTVIRFSVDVYGKISDVHMIQSSKDPKTDQIILGAIHTMKPWTPAHHQGKQIKQTFELVLGNSGC